MILISEIVEMKQRLPMPSQVRMLHSMDFFLIRQDPEHMFKTLAQHEVSEPVRNLRNEGWYYG